MQIQIPKRDLLRLASRAAAVAERKSTMPMLAMALLTARKSSLRASATDLYASITDAASADIKAPGSIAVNAADLLARVKALPEGPVELSAKDNALTIKAKGTARRFTLRTAPADDYPPLATPREDAPVLTIEAAVLSRLFALTHFSISPDESRPHLASLLLEWEDDTIRAVATDGHRLAMASCKVSGQAMASLLLPLKAVHELRRLADEAYTAQGDDPAKLTLVHSGPYLFVTSGNVQFSTKLTDAQFPPYRQVIPDSRATTVRLSRAAMAGAIKAVALADSAKGAVRLTLGKGVMRITSESPDGGDGVDEVPFEVVDGPGKALIGVNAKYILDVLGALSSEEVLLGVSGELDPLTLAPVGSEGFVAVVMPMRI